MIATSDPVPAAPAIPASRGKSIAELLATVSASRLNTFHTCRLKFYFNYVLGLARTKSAALHVGSTVSLRQACGRAEISPKPASAPISPDGFGFGFGGRARSATSGSARRHGAIRMGQDHPLRDVRRISIRHPAAGRRSDRSTATTLSGRPGRHRRCARCSRGSRTGFPR